MSKKLVLAIIVILTIAVISTVIVSIYKKQKIISPVQNTKIHTSQSDSFSSLKFKEYLDPSGYKFQYPEELFVATKEATDKNVYSSLDISSAKKTGNLLITIKNSDLQTIDSWLKTNNITADPAKVKKLNLADLDAYQFSTDGKIKTVALDQGALISIVVNPKQDKDFWEKVNQKLISSFAFIAPKTSNGQENITTSENNDDIILEEEVVE